MFGFRMPSLKRRITSRLSLSRIIRAKVRVPRGVALLTSPKKSIYNRVYNKTTVPVIK